MKYYEIDKDNTLMSVADFKFSDNCLETNKNIVRDFNGKLVFEEEIQTSEYAKAKANNDTYIENQNKIAEKQAELEELTKDLAQIQVGLIIENIEQKKERFRTLLNEIRVLQGKEPRDITQ